MKLRCAAVQLRFSTDKSENLRRVSEAVVEAADKGAEVACLPELATTEYFCHEMDRVHMELAEPIPGPATDMIAALAQKHDIAVILPLYEKGADGNLYNSAAFISHDGDVLGVHRKNIIPLTHAEGIGIDGYEKYYFRPGNYGYATYQLVDGMRAGTAICYERHFPESGRCLALAGADVIFVPTCTCAGEDVWELELRAMAVANTTWVVGINRIGPDEGGSGAKFYGKSLIISPAGEIVAQAGSDSREIMIAEIDTDAGARLREEWGFFRDRRPEAFASLVANDVTIGA